MEKINHIIKKISELNSQNNNIHILDIDIMMDYTRTLYVALLDKREQLIASGINISVSKTLSENKIEESSTTENFDTNTKSILDLNSHSNANLPPATDNIVTIPQEKPLPLVEIPKETIEDEGNENFISEKAEEEEIYNSNEDGSPLETNPSEIKMDAEPIAPIKEDISIPEVATTEKIQQAEKPTETQTTAEDTESEPEEIANEEIKPLPANEFILTEEKPPHDVAVEEKNNVITLKNEISLDHQNFNFKEIEIEQPTPTEPKVFTEINLELPVIDANKIPTAQAQPILSKLKQKDIRSFIGINDKYQFTNELFGNNKELYEKSLDTISQFTSFKEASNWLQNTAVKDYTWDKDDNTFLELLSITEKYFAAL